MIVKSFEKHPGLYPSDRKLFMVKVQLPMSPQGTLGIQCMSDLSQPYTLLSPLACFPEVDAFFLVFKIVLIVFF